MARGYKAGPFKALIAKKAKGKLAVAILPCPSCGTELPLIVDGKGHLNATCAVKDGCGLTLYARNKSGSEWLLNQVNKWADIGNLTLSKRLCREMELYSKETKEAPEFVSKPIEQLSEAQDLEPPKTETETPKKHKKPKKAKAKKPKSEVEEALI